MTARPPVAAALAPGFALAAALALAAPAAGAGCPPVAGAVAMTAAGDAAAGGDIGAALRILPGPVAVGRPFVAEVTVCAADAAASPVDRVEVDATMPRHRHGMNYLPEVAQVGPGRYEARGLLFHMPGLWRLEVALFRGGRPVRLTHDVVVE